MSPARPTTYCKVCGEYVATQPGLVYDDGMYVTKLMLTHIDGDGNKIHRAHKPLLKGE